MTAPRSKQSPRRRAPKREFRSVVQEKISQAPALQPFDEVKKARLAEALLSQPLSEAFTHATAPEEEGGLNLQIGFEELEEIFRVALKDAVLSASRNFREIAISVAEEEACRRIGAPVLCLLQERLQKLLASSKAKTDDIKTFFNLLLASRKLDLLEKKSAQAASAPKERSEEEKMEMIWDLFALPEEERARRRALWSERRNVDLQRELPEPTSSPAAPEPSEAAE